MRIGQLHMDAQDKTRFEILGKSSVKYHLKANHEVEAKRWVWALNNAIRWGKDEAKADEKRQNQSTELLRQAKLGQIEQLNLKDDVSSRTAGSEAGGLQRAPTKTAHDSYDDYDDAASVDMSVAGDDIGRPGTSYDNEKHPEGYEFADDASSIDVPQPVQRDAFMIAAQSARLQLDLLAQMSTALQNQRSRNPGTQLGEPAVSQALGSFEDAVSNLRGLVGDLNRIARDRESFWQSKLEREASVRRLWEDSMTRVAQEQELLENRIGESEEKRKRTRRALREALEGQLAGRTESFQSTRAPEALPSPSLEETGGGVITAVFAPPEAQQNRFRRKSTIAELTNLSDDDDDDEEEFFDAVDAGEVEVLSTMPSPVIVPEVAVYDEPTPTETRQEESQEEPREAPSVAHEESIAQREELPASKEELMKLSWKGYEDPVRKRLKMDADDRPKISLWVSCWMERELVTR